MAHVELKSFATVTNRGESREVAKQTVSLIIRVGEFVA